MSDSKSRPGVCVDFVPPDPPLNHKYGLVSARAEDIGPVKLTFPDAPGAKHDAGKRRWSLLPIDVLRGVCDVMEFGAQKYAAYSWMGVPEALPRYMDALDRHRDAIYAGEDTDAESKLPHWAHFACNALFAAWLIAKKPDQVKTWRARFAK